MADPVKRISELYNCGAGDLGYLSLSAWRRLIRGDISEGASFLAAAGGHTPDHLQPGRGELATCQKIQREPGATGTEEDHMTKRPTQVPEPPRSGAIRTLN